ncbi:MAG: ABC transporter ATP-binding protein [Coprococcus sp.]|nr:ABC transporter ATP-binding protein [Coprococcus sp.]
MSEYYFELKGLSVGYNGKMLIGDINIGINKGEIVTLIGPNGSGKSTILKTLTRQIRMIGGTVYFEGEDLHKLPHRRLCKRMSVVLTERMRPELMTCRDVVAAGRYPYTGRLGILSEEDERKVDAAMEIVRARELEDRDFNLVSDGQRQRIMLARAICQEPEVIILDEPTSFLDVRYKLELLSILKSMARKEQITVIMSLHEIDLAQKISDKIMCVKGERISQFGVPEEVFKEEVIRELYGIDNGFFDPCFGSIELPGPVGTPEVFVLSSCGTGIPVFRRLQKEGTPFAAGILYRNDIDYEVARLLASRVIAEEPFCEISDQAYEDALRMVESCRRVIDAGVAIGICNQRMERLMQTARKSGKLERWER